jgi:hypothetical protein
MSYFIEFNIQKCYETLNRKKFKDIMSENIQD